MKTSRSATSRNAGKGLFKLLVLGSEFCGNATEFHIKVNDALRNKRKYAKVSNNLSMET
jgi:hypothetical protein